MTCFVIAWLASAIIGWWVLENQELETFGSITLGDRCALMFVSVFSGPAIVLGFLCGKIVKIFKIDWNRKVR